MDRWIRASVANVLGGAMLLLIGVAGCDSGKEGAASSPPTAASQAPQPLLAQDTRAEKAPPGTPFAGPLPAGGSARSPQAVAQRRGQGGGGD